MNPFLACDGYKVSHMPMYPDGTTLVYGNFTPRSNKHAPKGCEKVLVFGTLMTFREIVDMFDKEFFYKSEIENEIERQGGFQGVSSNTEKLIKGFYKERVCMEIKKEYSLYLNTDYDVSHIERLWDLGYLPIKVKALPEGTLCPMGVPVLTIYNTHPDFFWLPNFLETLISNLLWKPMTSATIAFQYRKLLTQWALKTDKDNVDFVLWQGHDFSMRGMDSLYATQSSGLGHAICFYGSDSLPVIHAARKYYDANAFVVGSVPATEHSVMCAGTKDDEIGTFRRLMKIYPTGLLAIVSDTWNLWKVITEYLPILKDEILARDGKIVIRPDSGDPVDIICGIRTIKCSKEEFDELFSGRFANIPSEVEPYDEHFILTDGKRYNYVEKLRYVQSGLYLPVNYKKDCKSISKGVVELLWDIFGGTINKQGYKVLDPHIGAIYGDSITLKRAEEICKRLEAKGFASTNIVLGIGSFTYQYNTRDTFGFAMKATYVEIKASIFQGGKDEVWIMDDNDEPIKVENVVDVDMNVDGGVVKYAREIFKDPITDDGTKKSAKGLLHVEDFGDEGYILSDQVSWEIEEKGALQEVFVDGKFTNKVTLEDIRNRVDNLLKQQLNVKEENYSSTDTGR